MSNLKNTIMGGNAFKDENGEPLNVRLDKTSYLHHVCNTVLPCIRAWVHHETRVELLRHVREKSSFGDADIIVETIQDSKVCLRHFIDLHLNNPKSSINITGFKKNGDVWSLLWDDFQIDLIFARSADFEFTRNYFAWNDFGNLVGRITRPYDFKFGHAGLYWIFRRPDNGEKFSEILITKNFSSALDLFGFDSERYFSGFDTFEDMFSFVQSTPHFDPEYFNLERRSNKDRVRDRKRKIYTAFVEWAHKNPKPEDSTRPLTQVELLIRAQTQFPKFQEEHWHQLHEYGKMKRWKQVASGSIVSKITQLEGIQLGEFMKYLRRDNEFNTFVQNHKNTPDDVRRYIKTLFDGYSKENA